MMGASGHVAFLLWQGLVRIFGRALPCSWCVRLGTGEEIGLYKGAPPLVPAALRGYDAPFPNADYKALSSSSSFSHKVAHNVLTYDA